MAAAVYSTDLVDIIASITSTTGWTALGGGASGLGVGADFAMQGSNAIDKQVTAAEKGMVYTGSATLGANDHIFTWIYLATAGLADTLALRGLTVTIGTATNAYNSFHVEGNDTYGAVGRVGRCYPVRYVTTSNGSVPYRTLTGSPGANPTVFGAQTNQTATVKGANLGISAIRYGTGIYITAGDSGQPATFTGTATQNDTINNRWGVFTFLGGSNYELQGRFVVGQSTAGTPTLAYFEDSNKNILLVDTPHSLTDFTQIIVDHASTVFNLTNVSIEAAGTNNRGNLIFNNASTTSALTGCNFVKMNTTTLRAGVTVDGCAWRQNVGLITQNGATISNSIISNSAASVALAVDNLSLVTGNTFVSTGTGHAVEFPTLITSNTSVTWDNTDSGYAATNGSTGNETILCNVDTGITLTINVAAGASTPTYRNTGAGTVNVVSGLVNFSFTVSPAITGYEYRLYTDSVTPGVIGTVELVGEESSGTVSHPNVYSYSYTTDFDVALQIIATGYEESITYLTLSNINTSITVNLIPDNNL